MFMEGRRRGEDRRVYLERCSTRDWYDHLELEVAPYFKGRRLKRPALKQCIRATIAEAMRLLREETDGLQGVVGNQSFLKQKKPKVLVCHDRAEHERQPLVTASFNASLLTTCFLAVALCCIF